MKCDKCDGLGYIEYETGVTDGVYKEALREPCECYGVKIMGEVINTGLSNYYGHVTAVKEDDGKCYLLLDDYGSTSSVKISEELFELIKKELG